MSNTLSKEQILERYRDDSNFPNMNTVVFFRRDALDAMDEYAKDHAISYGIFLTKLIRDKMDLWLQGIDSPVEGNTYELFLTHLKSKEKQP